MRIMLSGPDCNIRKLGADLGTILATLVICLLALEFGVRVADRVPIISGANFIGLELDQIHKADNVAAEYDSHLGWVQRPNLKLGGFTTGEYGVRMPSSKIVPLAQGGILVVGDSFAMGSDVTDAEAWPAQLDRALGEQVIDAAVGGYGFDQTVLRAEMLAGVLKPSILLVQTRLQYGLYVSRLSMYSGAPKPYFLPRDARLVPENQPVPRVASSRRDIGWIRAVFGHSYLMHFTMKRLGLSQWWIAPEKSQSIILSPDEELKVGCLLLHRLFDLRAQLKIKISLVLQYTGEDAMNEKLSWFQERDAFLACADMYNIPIVDTLDALRAAYKKDDLKSYQKLWVMSDNNRLYGHMSEQGNALIAKIVQEKLFPQAQSSAK